MINEYQWAKDLYDGVRKPSNSNNYGDCLYLARYILTNKSNIPDVCKDIYKWGKENNIFFDNRIVPVCQKAQNMPPLRNYVDIHISQDEIDRIRFYLHKKNSQLLALAMLCYAKAFHSPSESFDISTYQLELWTGIQRENISGRYIKDLENMDILHKVEPTPMDYWKGFAKNKMNKYKFTFPLVNEGEYVLKDNGIVKFFNKVFKK